MERLAFSSDALPDMGVVIHLRTPSRYNPGQ